MSAEMFTSLPTTSAAQLTDIICAVQGYESPSVLGISVQETLGQIATLFAATIGAITWAQIGGTTQAAAVNTGYIVDDNSLTTITLPATAAFGSVVSVRGLGTAGWRLQANTGQTIKYVGATTSSGGSLSSAEQYDTVDVTCISANLIWSVNASSTTGLTVA